MLKDARRGAEPSPEDGGLPAKIIKVPVWTNGDTTMMREPCTQTPRSASATYINEVPWLDVHLAKSTDPDSGMPPSTEQERISTATMAQVDLWELPPFSGQAIHLPHAARASGSRIL